MKTRSIALIAVAGLSLPATALADDCAHVRNIDLDLQLEGARKVAFEVGAHDLEVRGTADAAGTLDGRACAWSESALDSMRVVQARRGDTLVVRLESDGDRRWGLFGSRYATFDLSASVPAGLPVEIGVRSGDARVTGVASLQGAVGSGDLQASDIAGRVTLSVGSGDVQLKDIGELDVGSIGSGDLTASRVRGGAGVGSIGSGDFELYGAGGDVNVGSVGSGDVGVRNIDGSLTVGSVGSGDVQANEVRGDLVVRSVGSGDVDHRGIGGRVQLPADD